MDLMKLMVVLADLPAQNDAAIRVYDKSTDRWADISSLGIVHSGDISTPPGLEIEDFVGIFLVRAAKSDDSILLPQNL